MPPNTFSLNLGADGKLPLRYSGLPEVGAVGIYVFREDKEIIRIGESSSGLKRIISGFRVRFRSMRNELERKNYTAYHWREDYAGRSVDVDFFELDPVTFADSHIRRALEAELTFQVRLAQKKWPKLMSEIHFLEKYRVDPSVVDAAKDILTHYGHVYDSVS